MPAANVEGSGVADKGGDVGGTIVIGGGGTGETTTCGGGGTGGTTVIGGTGGGGVTTLTGGGGEIGGKNACAVGANSVKGTIVSVAVGTISFQRARAMSLLLTHSTPTLRVVQVSSALRAARLQPIAPISPSADSSSGVRNS
jgi:hypothetical protein